MFCYLKVLSYIITLISVLSNDSIGFPYNEDLTSPKQKRLVILKTEREFIDSYAQKDSIENTISAKDSGFTLSGRFYFLLQNFRIYNILLEN